MGGEKAKADFVGEPIKPVAGSSSAGAMATGAPGLPARFVWRGDEHEVADVLEVWKESGPCRSGGGERYLRKHWYRVRTRDGAEMTLYFERQARSKAQQKKRWWLYTVSAPSAD